MFDTAAIPPFQRVQGRASVRLSDGRLRDLYQSGSAKVMLPRVFDRAPEVVFLNTAGGLTGGDRLDYALHVETGRAVATTQTAERAYRSPGPVAQVETHLTLGAGAVLHWLPQELILFDGAALDRRLRVEMGAGAELVCLETLILGRVAMGERVTALRLTDRREILCGGRPLVVEAIRLGDEDLADESAAGLNGAVATATLTLIAEDAEDRLAALRSRLPVSSANGPVRAAASAWNGRLIARFLSPAAYPLRRAVARAVAGLTRAPLPRVWQI